MLYPRLTKKRKIKFMLRGISDILGVDIDAYAAYTDEVPITPTLHALNTYNESNLIVNVDAYLHQAYDEQVPITPTLHCINTYPDEDLGGV